jgi:histo-blood group ABO system transferase
MNFSAPKQVGLLVIATNRYIEFVGPLWESAKKFFMVGTPHRITMFVFTNMPKVPEGTVRIQQEHSAWPMPTLMRYHTFVKNEEPLKNMDYLFYCDADMRFEASVGEEIFGDLVATRHPGFWDKPYPFFSQSYEKRPQSMAYMPPGYGKAYYAGGFNGGRADRYLAMAKEIKGWIDQDMAKGIIAVWHDESHMNKYLASHPPTIELSPAYCYQEEATLPFPRKLVALKKNHSEWRS